MITKYFLLIFYGFIVKSWQKTDQTEPIQEHFTAVGASSKVKLATRL